MLRTNLATRPFYNERAAHVVIGVAGVLVFAITVFNVMRMVTLSRHNTELSSRIGAEHSEVERLTTEAARIRKTINNDELAQVVGAAQEANSLIDQRTFSWTEFFNRIEATLPPDVMLTAVHPSIRDGMTQVMMMVLAKRAADVEEFNDKLEATGAFEHIVTAKSDHTESGLYRAVIESIYTGVGTDSAEPETETPAANTPAAPAHEGTAPGEPSAEGPAAPKTTPPPAGPGRSGGRQ